MIHTFTFKTYFATNPLIVLFFLEYLEWENSVAASVCVSVHPSFCMGQFSLHSMNFDKMRHMGIVWKSVEKIQVPLKFDKNNGNFTWRLLYIYDVTCHSSLLGVRNVSDGFVEEKHVLCSVNFCWKLCHLLDNVEKEGRATDDNITWHVHFAYWVTEATDTHSEYVILIAFPQQQWLHECTSVLRYTYSVLFAFDGAVLLIFFL
jgi:hypothetical protein